MRFAMNLASLVLIGPGCVLTCALLGVYILTVVSWDVLLWQIMQALALAPLALAVIAGVVLGLLTLLVRLPALFTALLFQAGLASFVILLATTSLWSDGRQGSDWLVLGCSLLGTLLAALQLRRLIPQP